MKPEPEANNPQRESALPSATLLDVPATITGSIAARDDKPCGCKMREKALRMPAERNGCATAYPMRHYRWQGTLGTSNLPN